MATKNAIARRRKPSPMIGKLSGQLKNTRSRLTALKARYESNRVPDALMSAGCSLAGAVGGQILEEFVGDDVMGVPTSVGAALLLAGAGVALKQPKLIHAAGGAMTPYIAEYARDTVANWRSKSNDNTATVGPKAVEGGN